MRKRYVTAALVSALFFSCVLLIAAIAKIFYPIQMPPPWKTLSFIVAGFELLFAACVLRYYSFARMWSVVAIVTAGWAGYSFFWLLAKLPCGCMGKMLDLPSGMTFSFDLIFLCISLILITKFKRFSYATLGLAAIVGLLGYFAASCLFTLLE